MRSKMQRVCSKYFILQNKTGMFHGAEFYTPRERITSFFSMAFIFEIY